jgi:DNA-binding PadR family transcriptional regulator
MIAIYRECKDSDGKVQLEIGSLYRLLGRLLNDDLIDMEQSDGRRQFYSLSRFGKTVLRAEAHRLAGLVDLLRVRKLVPGTD